MHHQSMSKRPIFALAVCLAASFGLLGCEGGDTSSTTGETTTSMPTTGTVKMAFTLSNGAKQSPALVDPLKGTVYGSIFHQEDVTVTGPIDGAMDVASVEVAGVDITMTDVSEATWQSEEIEPGAYVFLGFFDLDANGTMTYEPDPGDPVTFPSANKFDITAGEETSLTTVFDLIYN